MIANAKVRMDMKQQGEIIYVRTVQAVPLFFKLRTVVLEHFFQAICHLFHNVVGDLFHVLVAL